MNTEIVKLDPKEFGLEETKAADISAQFKPMLDKMVELENEYNEVIKLPVEDIKTAVLAKALRLKYVKVRTGTAEIHAKQKAFYLSGGRYVDGWKNAQLFASQGIEGKLEEIEKFAANKEKERIKKLHQDREASLAPFHVENIYSLPLGTMSEEVFANFLTGARVNFEQKQDAERKAKEAEEIRIKEEAEERERTRLENERLTAEAAKRETEIKKEREAAEKKAAADRKKAEAERTALLERQRKEMEAAQAEQKKILEAHRIKEQQAETERKRLQAENEKKLAAERQEREKLAKELQAKKAAEAKAEAEKQAEIEAAASMGDKDKFTDLLMEISALKLKYTFKSKKYQSVYNSVNELLEKTIVYANSKV